MFLSKQWMAEKGQSVKGQSAMEYTILLILVMASFLAAGNYIKRGIQGRWKEAVDSVGEQYDPQLTDSSIRHVLISNSETRIKTVPDEDGYWTMRTDTTNSIQTKKGDMSVLVR